MKLNLENTIRFADTAPKSAGSSAEGRAYMI